MNRRLHIPRIPQGCDQQGRMQQAWPARRAGMPAEPDAGGQCVSEVLADALDNEDADFPDASAQHVPMLTHALGWVVACIGWALGVTAAQWFADVGAFGVPLTMATGAAWIFVCIGLKRGFVHAAQAW
jgi:hypothetical protein